MKIMITGPAKEYSGKNPDGREWNSRSQDAKLHYGDGFVAPLRVTVPLGQEYEPGEYRIAADGFDFTKERGIFARRPYKLERVK